MSMRISSAVFGAILLAGCSGEPLAENASGAPEAVASAGADEGRLLCAVEGYEGFAPACSVERHYDASGLLLIVRLPDGGFRRLRVADGALVAADGAEQARVTPAGEGAVEVAIGDARVRLPDTMLN
jgi:hypothetical protein